MRRCVRDAIRADRAGIAAALREEAGRTVAETVRGKTLMVCVNGQEAREALRDFANVLEPVKSTQAGLPGGGA